MLVQINYVRAELFFLPDFFPLETPSALCPFVFLPFILLILLLLLLILTNPVPAPPASPPSPHHHHLYSGTLRGLKEPSWLMLLA